MKWILTLCAVAMCSWMSAYESYTWDTEPESQQLIGVECVMGGMPTICLTHYHPRILGALKQLGSEWAPVDDSEVLEWLHCRIPFSYVVPKPRP